MYHSKGSYYQMLWEARKRVFDPEEVSFLKKLYYRLTNFWRAAPICLTCGKEKGYWRSTEPICYKCDLV